MLPFIAPKSWVFCDARAYRQTPIQRWDVVAARIPSLKNLVIKRVVGLPNEAVELKDGKLWVNGVPITASPIDFAPNEPRRWRLGADEFVLLGDNWFLSRDSRHFGAINRHNIRGRISKIEFSLFAR